MKKVILLTVIMILALASVSWAVLPNTGPRITYGGYVQKNTDGTVAADTVIFVFNPNNFNITGAGIAVFDKYGVKVADTSLLNGGTPITQIPPKGWGWQTIGNLIPTPLQPVPATKYTFVVYWTKPTSTPNRGLVIEIKEIIYYGIVYPVEGWQNSYNIWTWSEAAIGKGGTGFSGN